MRAQWRVTVGGMAMAIATALAVGEATQPVPASQATSRASTSAPATPAPAAASQEDIAPVRGSTKKPVPEVLAQTAAMKLVEELNRPYPPAGADEKVAKAKAFMRQAAETRDNVAGQYVLLREARELSLAAGDARTAMRAADAMSRIFAVDAQEARLSVLLNLRVATMNLYALGLAAEVGMKAAEQAMSSDDFEAAVKLAEQAQRYAATSRDPPLAAAVRARLAEMRTIREEAAKAEKSLARIKEAPNDAEACLVAGKFYLFARADPQRGLPLLAAGSEPKLAELARQEIALTKPGAAPGAAAVPLEARVTMASDWWEAGEKLPTLRPLIRNHAARWYRAALPELSGLTKALADSRVKAAASDDAPPAVSSVVAMVGRWSVTVGPAGRVEHVHFSADSTATYTDVKGMPHKGKWGIEEEAVVVRWDTGWTQVLKLPVSRRMTGNDISPQGRSTHLLVATRPAP